MNPRETIVSIITVSFIIFSTFFVSYSEYKKSSKKSIDLSSEILLFRDNLSTELLSQYDIKKYNIPNEINDLNMEQFIRALKQSEVGGYSHPVYEKHLIFSEKKIGIHFIISVDVGHDGKRKFTNVSISKYDGDKIIDGLNFKSKELEEWCEKIDLL